MKISGRHREFKRHFPRENKNMNYSLKGDCYKSFDGDIVCFILIMIVWKKTLSNKTLCGRTGSKISLRIQANYLTTTENVVKVWLFFQKTLFQNCALILAEKAQTLKFLRNRIFQNMFLENQFFLKICRFQILLNS